MTIGSTHDYSVFNALCQVAEKRADEIEQFGNAENKDSSDVDQDSQHPVHYQFCSSIGPEGIHKMTVFSPDEIWKIYDVFASAVTRIWNQDSGKRCVYIVFDVLFMIFTVYRNGGAWDFQLQYSRRNLAHFST